MKSNNFILLLLLSLVALLPLNASAAARLGGWSPIIRDVNWSPIRDVKGPHVVKVGKFAVSEHVKQSHYKVLLNFETVVSGETLVVYGTNYRLIVSASDGVASKNYQAIVSEQPFIKTMELISFKLA